MRIILAAIAAFVLASAAQATVTTANVNCRIRPAASSSVAERIPRGSTVSVVERQRTWSKLRRDRGCWVASRYLGGDGRALDVILRRGVADNQFLFEG